MFFVHRPQFFCSWLNIDPTLTIKTGPVVYNIIVDHSFVDIGIMDHGAIYIRNGRIVPVGSPLPSSTIKT
jgi:imidazolonepropionase-like amidohydrolase